MPLLHDILRGDNPQKAINALQNLSTFINTPDERGHTPMVILARRDYGNFDTARRFFKTCVEMGGDIDQHNGDNRTPLYHAVEVASRFAVKAILEHHPRLDLIVDGSYSLLHKAVLVGDSSVIRLLCKHCPAHVLRKRDRITGDTFFHDMIDRPVMNALLTNLARRGDLDAVIEVPNYAGETPFSRANRRRNTTAMIAITEIRNILDVY